jgi:hypothetical protein
VRARIEKAVSAAERGDFGLPMADVQAIGKKLRRNRSAIILLFENTWERRLKEVAARYGGADAIAASARKIAAGAKPRARGPKR